MLKLRNHFPKSKREPSWDRKQVAMALRLARIVRTKGTTNLGQLQLAARALSTLSNERPNPKLGRVALARFKADQRDRSTLAHQLYSIVSLTREGAYDHD